MRLTGSISEASRLLPAPKGRPVASVLTKQAVQPAPAPVARGPIWNLSRETAAAAVAAQMLGGSKRGLRAGAAERARFAREYLRWDADPAETGLIANDTL